MAANPLFPCGSATSWYDFSPSLSWSNNCEVAEVLSDIPFITVGTLMFGVSVLFLVLKRISLSVVWFFCSASLAFVAAVLDLGQTLAGETTMGTTLITSNPAIKAREVFFAFSIGFRFLFYWSYVAEPPLKTRCAASTRRGQRVTFLALEHTNELHSGSWMRWGLPGKLLGVSLLAAIITITALQIVWRVVPRFHQYSDVYAADAALALLVSFLLLLKLLLNTITLDSPDSMLVYTFKECLAPISGLLINIAIGIGNLLFFAFTESTVGRLLQAFEVHIIVVFVVVTASIRHRDILLSVTSSQGNAHRDVVFTLPEPARQSTLRITTPFIDTPRMSTVLSTAAQNKESSRDVLRRSARRSLNHVSSWLSSRVSRNRLRYEDEVTLWNSEERKLNPSYTGNADTELQARIVSLMQEPKEWAELVRDASPSDMSITSASDAQAAIPRSDQILHPHLADLSQCTIPLQARTSSVPISSVSASGAKHTGRRAIPEGSPVCGFGGVRSLPDASDSQASLDELLRQQSQLDQNIQVLKSFSTRTSTNASSYKFVNPKNVELTRSPSTGQKTVSSDVSLSSFPVPPWLIPPVPSLPSPCSPSMKRARGDRRVRITASRPTPVQDTHSSLPPKTSASLFDIPNSSCSDSVPPSSPGKENKYLSAKAGESYPSDSGEKQYNVTSFIGSRLFLGPSGNLSNVVEDLATPGEPRQEEPLWTTESESNAVTIQTGSGTKFPPRTLLVSRQLEGLPASPARTSRLPQGEVVDATVDAMQYRINDRASRSLAPGTDRAAKGVSIPSTRPHFMRETGSPITVSVESTEQIQPERRIVRPRPPPLALQSSGEQIPDTPRVQVLADD